MTKLLFILLLILSIGFTQDEYPYFSDSAKQLEFEKKKIYIKKVDNKELAVTGGGSVYNWLHIIDNNQPMYINSPITSGYIYNYSFEMKVGKNIITEIDLLNVIGLTDEAKKIETNFKNELKKWEKNKYYIEEVPNKTLSIIAGINGVSGLWCLGMGLIGLTFDPPTAIFFLEASVPFLLGWGGIIHLAKKNPQEEKVFIEKPKYVQIYTDEQLISLSESYNRKLYKQLTND